MNLSRAQRRYSIPFLALILSALVGALLASGVTTPARADQVASAQSHAHGKVVPRNAAQNAFHDQMRKLWEDHVTWTRLAIVTFAEGSPGFDATAVRLLQNQTGIGDAIKPFYGAAAGKRLTSLLSDHITIAVEVLQAAKAGDTAAFSAANSRWYANGNDIADFLAAVNPRSWPRAVMRADMKTHLDATLAQAAHELHGEYAASVTDYEGIHSHILMMADQLSAGVMTQFPSRFR